MKLYEYEAKKILQKYGLEVPDKRGEEYAVKAQVITSSRKEKGGIKFAESRDQAEELKDELLGSEIGGHKVEKVLIEEKSSIYDEQYICFTYDADFRAPTLIYSEEGGTGVEDKDAEKYELGKNPDFEYLLDSTDENLIDILEKLFEAFMEEDIIFLEVNPLALTEKGYEVIDALIELDDDAGFRHDWGYSERTAFSRKKTQRERKAEKIDEDDHRGVAGKYIELDGDIAMMLAGGGASLTNMDAMIEYGGEPANYTEYGGNPPAEKVYRLSKIILSKSDLKGCWHVGGTANNTDIYRTMKGFCQALEEVDPDFPIVVRRDGPNADKAFELLRKTRDELDLDMKLYRRDTPMTETAEDLLEMIEDE